MEPILHRHKNIIVLAVVLLAQFLGLAAQVRRSTEGGSVPLLRVWALELVLPLERGVVHSSNWFDSVWNNYFYLRNVRHENEDLRRQLDQMKVQQVRLQEDAKQARRIQTLLGFKEQYVYKTVAAQVVGSSGSEHSRLVYIDKGSNDGLKPDMPVITPEGIVGKLLNVYAATSQVLVITDPSSGVGAMLANSRVQGILKGTANTFETSLDYVMGDEKISVGDQVVSSGGSVYPKGLPIGWVSRVGTGRNAFLDIRVRPSARLERLEEVLVITQTIEQAPATNDLGPIRAADILAERLPGLPQQKTDANAQGTQPNAAGAQASSAPGATAPKPTQSVGSKPATSGATTGAGTPASKPKPLNAQPKPAQNPAHPAATQEPR